MCFICRAMVIIMHATCMRSDDARQIYLSDIAKPTVIAGVTPVMCLLWGMVLRHTKTGDTDKADNVGMVRSSDVFQCPVGALGRLLVHRFTIGKEPFPDPTKDMHHW